MSNESGDLVLQPFLYCGDGDFKILHCTGPSNVIADALSRPPTTSTCPDTHHASLEAFCELCLKGVSFGEGVPVLVVGRATDKNSLRCPSFPQDSHITKCNFGGDIKPRVGILAPPKLSCFSPAKIDLEELSLAQHVDRTFKAAIDRLQGRSPQTQDVFRLKKQVLYRRNKRKSKNSWPSF
jgi:hypothetical protein